MSLAWEKGGWTIYLDELYYVEQQLRLSQQVNQLLTQGRSQAITVVLGIQRPAWVSRFALSEPTHILSASLGDRRDAKTVSQIVGETYLEAVEKVSWHKFVWLNKVNGEQKTIDKYTVGREMGEVAYGV